LISDNPKLFPITKGRNVRKAVVKKLNTLYYREKENKRIEILSFFQTDKILIKDRYNKGKTNNLYFWRNRN